MWKNRTEKDKKNWNVLNCNAPQWVCHVNSCNSEVCGCKIKKIKVWKLLQDTISSPITHKTDQKNHTHTEKHCFYWFFFFTVHFMYKTNSPKAMQNKTCHTLIITLRQKVNKSEQSSAPETGGRWPLGSGPEQDVSLCISNVCRTRARRTLWLRTEKRQQKVSGSRRGEEPQSLHFHYRCTPAEAVISD